MRAIVMAALVVGGGLWAGSAGAVMDTWSKPFATVDGWVVTAEGVDGLTAGKTQWCRAVGRFGRQSVTLLANSSTYGRLAVFTRQDKPAHLAGGGHGVRGADPRPCATGKPGDAPAGSLRMRWPQLGTEICDGKHPWHEIVEESSAAELKIGGRVVAEGSARGTIDPLTGGKDMLYSSAEFRRVAVDGTALKTARTLSIVPEDRRFPKLSLSKAQLDGVLVTLNRCLPAEAKLF